MADNENIGGISVEIVGDYAPLAADLEAAQKAAEAAGKDIADAFTSAAAGADELGTAVAGAVSSVDNFEQRIQELVDSGHTLAEALAEVEGESAAFSEELASTGETAASAAEQLSLFDEAASVPYEDAAGQLNLFATELEPIPEAAESGADALQGLGQQAERTSEEIEQDRQQLAQWLNTAQQVDEATNEATASFGSLAEQLVAVGSALAFTAGMTELGHAALEAADEVDDATKSLGMLSGNAEEATRSVDQLRQLANDSALSFPELLKASQRMTAFLGSSKEVPKVLEAVSNSAAVMGTNVGAASSAFERIVASGDLSQRSLLRLGLTMEDVGKAMGVTAEEAKDAFKELTQTEQIDVMIRALDKFNGAAKALSDDSLGALVRIGNAWRETLEQIGTAMEPVIKGMADFVLTDVVPYVQGLVKAFQDLPGPVQSATVAFAALSVALVAVGTASGGIAVAAGAIGPALSGLVTTVNLVGGAFAGLGGFLGVGLVVAVAAAAAAFNDLNAAMTPFHEKTSAMQSAFDKWIDNAVKTAKSLDEIATVQQKVNAAVDAGALSAKTAAGYITMLSDAEKAAMSADLPNYAEKLGLQIHIVGLEAKGTGAHLDAAAIRMKGLKDAVTQTKQAMDLATATFDGSAKSTDNVSKAYDAWQKATNALKAAQQSHVPVLKQTAQEIEHIAKVVKPFNMELLNTPSAADVADASMAAFGARVQATNHELEAARTVLVALQKGFQDGTVSEAEFAAAGERLAAAQKAVNAELLVPPTIDYKPTIQNFSEILALLNAMPPSIQSVTIGTQNLANATKEQSEFQKNVLADLKRGYEDMVRSIGDVIFAGKDMGEAFKQVGKELVRMITEDWIDAGFKALYKEIKEIDGGVLDLGKRFKDLGNQITSIFGGGSTGSKTKGATSGAVGSLGGVVDAISGIGTLISSIISNFQLAKLETTMNAVEHNTRYTEIIQEEFKRDQWDQHYALLSKLDDIWNAMLNVGDAIVSALAGAAIQVGEAVGQQIDRMPGVNRAPRMPETGGATTYGDFTGYQIGPTYTPDISSPSSAGQVSPSMYSSSSSSSTVGGITINVNGGSTPMATARAVASELRAAIPIWTTFGT